MLEDFKLFVRKMPSLAKFVNNGDITWQKLYEQWRLYGEDESVWKDYKEFKIEENKETFNFSDIGSMLKNIDVNQVQKGINSLQKIIELLQGLNFNDTNTKDNNYKPRQLFKKFED